jgi:phage replication O-like protein O
MANVQTENGYTKIANELLEQMALTKFSPIQYRIIFVIWRYTYGFNRKEHEMSLNFLHEATNYDKRQLQRELTKLEERKIITQTVESGSSRVIGFNKNHDEWDGNSTKGKTTIGNSTNTGVGKTTNSGVGNSTKGAIGKTTNQERNTKESIKESKKESRKSKIYDEDSIHFQLASRLYKKILKNNPDHKKPNLQKWADDVRLMLEQDKRTEEQIIYLIDWVQQDSFWKSNILSIGKLREKYDQLVIRLKEQTNRNKDPSKIPRAYQSLQDWAVGE